MLDVSFYPPELSTNPEGIFSFVAYYKDDNFVKSKYYIGLYLY